MLLVFTLITQYIENIKLQNPFLGKSPCFRDLI